MIVFLDLETRSRCDIKQSGGHVYVRDESTELLCGVAVVVDDSGGCIAHLWGPHECLQRARWHVADAKLEALGIDPAMVRWEDPEVTPGLVSERLLSWHAAGATFVAHNAEGFDRPALEHHGFPADAKWVDTMHKARQSGLPSGLDAVGEELFSLGKDKRGQASLRVLMVPSTKKIMKGKFVKPSRGTLGVVARYCALDVFLMLGAWRKEGWHLPHADDEVLRVHVKMDRRGLCADLDLAQMLLDESERLKEEALSRVDALGVERSVVTSPVQLLKWASSEGVVLPNAQKLTLQTALTSGVATRVATVIEARLACNRVTMGKAKAALAMTCPDGRLRGTLSYHGAHTGRWAGRGFQTHNLTSPVKGFTEKAYDQGVPAVAASLGKSEEDILASMLRGIITAEPGRRLAMIDYNQIEARVLLWMSGDDEGLQVFRDGRDIYKVAAAGIYGVPYDSVEKSSIQRLVGKVSTLALGYQGGVGALQAMADGYGLNFEDEGIDPEEVVNAWRDSNPLIAGVRKGFFYPDRVREAGWKGSRAVTKTKPRSEASLSKCECGASLKASYTSGGDLEWLHAHTNGKGEVTREDLRDREGNLIGYTCRTERESVDVFTGRVEERAVSLGRQVVTRKGGLWKDIQQAAKLAILGQPMEAGRCHFRMRGANLHVTLPSGRPMVYRAAQWIPWENNYGGTTPAVTFMGVRFGKVAREATYGGRLTENLCQAIARDIMGVAMVNLEEAGLPPLFTVHDEIIASVLDGEKDAVVEVMTQSPEWAKDLPLAAGGEIGARYGK